MVKKGSIDWIAESAIWIEKAYAPTLNLVYLPHLDYNLQRFGPRHPSVNKDYEEIDQIVGRLIDHFEERSVQVILLSEYGMTEVSHSIPLNRLFRQNGWVTTKEELGREMLDAGASQVFAVADHQVAHVYVNDVSLIPKVRDLLDKGVGGVAQVLGGKEKAELNIDHPRSGDLIAVAEEAAWFSYYYWLDDQRAPDFARCVDIHRKPGYDPVELFLDPKIPLPKLKILRRLLQKKLGFRMLMDVISLDPSLVRGSHGARPSSIQNYPVFISNRPELLPKAEMQPSDVYHAIKRHFL